MIARPPTRQTTVISFFFLSFFSKRKDLSPEEKGPTFSQVPWEFIKIQAKTFFFFDPISLSDRFLLILEAILHSICSGRDRRLCLEKFRHFPVHSSFVFCFVTYSLLPGLLSLC